MSRSPDEYLSVNAIVFGHNFVYIAGNTHNGWFKVLTVDNSSYPIEIVNLDKKLAKDLVEKHAPGYVGWGKQI